MGETKELNIKNQTYYYLNDMIDIGNFHSNLLKINKKSYKDVGIYYIGYITIKKFGENIHSVNPLYLIIRSATGNFNEKNVKKYLVIDLTEKYEDVFAGIRWKWLMEEKKCFMEKIMLELGLVLMTIYL